MAKKSAVEKNNKRKKLANKLYAKRMKLKETASDKTLSIEERFAASMKLTEMPRDSSLIRIRNRCEITGRPRAFYRKFKMSRIALRELANQGLLCGVLKASW